MAVVAAPIACDCALCRCSSKEIHRRWIADRSGLRDAELERKVTESWHHYAPWLRKLDGRMPARCDGIQCHEIEETHALTKLRAWHDRVDEFEGRRDGDEMVVLAGTPGTGKTFAAVWLALNRLAINTPTFITAQALSRKRGADFEEMLASDDDLIIDDLGTERADDRFVALFDEVVDAYYQRPGATLLITTNCTSKEFARRYGARVVDRFAEIGTWIPVVGASLRRRQASREVGGSVT